jgi:hypothetical protein
MKHRHRIAIASGTSAIVAIAIANTKNIGRLCVINAHSGSA